MQVPPLNEGGLEAGSPGPGTSTLTTRLLGLKVRLLPSFSSVQYLPCCGFFLTKTSRVAWLVPVKFYFPTKSARKCQKLQLHVPFRHINGTDFTLSIKLEAKLNIYITINA